MPADSNDPQDEVISETNSSSTLVSPEGQMTPDGEAVSGDFFGDMSVSDLPRPQPPVFVTTNNTNNTGSTTGQAINHSPVSVSPPVGVSPAGASINQDDNVSTPTQESTIINDSNNRRVSWRDEVDVPSYREDFAQRFRQAQRETTVNEQTGVNSSSLPAPGSETTLRPELETVFTRRRERLGQLPESGRDFAVRAQTTAASADSPAVRNTEEVPVQEIPSTRRQLESTTETPVSVSRTSTEREPATTTIATQDSETRSTRPARESAAVDIPRQEISESVRAERASVQTNTEYQEPRTISTSTTTARESITTNAPNQESTEFVRPAREPTRANTGPQEHITTSTREAESGSNNAFGREPRSQTLVAERDVSRETTSSTQAAKIDTAGNTPLLEREPVVTTRAREAADTSKVSLSEQTTTLVTPAERGDSILARAQESVTDTQVPARELRVRVSEPEITNARVSSTSEGSSSISNASRSVAPATSTTPPSEERIVSASSRQQTVEAANIATSAGQTTQPTPNTDTSTSADQIPTRTANLKQEVTNDLAQFDREQEALAQEQIAAVEERQLQDRLASQARGEAQLTAVRETPPPVNTGSTPGPAEKIDLTPPAPETPVTPITIADTTDSVTQDLNVTPPASETLTASQAPTRPQAEEKAAATLTNNREAVPSSTLTTPSAQVEKPAPVRVSAADVAVETADQTPILERETTPVSHQTETIPNASAFARNQEDFASVRPVETVTPQTIERPVKAASTDAVVPRQPEANAPMPVETLKPPSPNIENPTRVETVNQTPQAAPIVVDDPAFAPTVAPTPATPTREALNIPVSPRETTTQTQQSTTGEIGKAASTSTKPTLNTDTATSANQTPTRTANLKQEVSNDLAQFDRDQEVLAQQQIAAVEQRQLQDRLAS
ncbi:hypothetical protein IJJ08_00310, partial [bacterium]|nr:hypothetical protein [bacterium]